MGKKNSSTTRVVPIFDYLYNSDKTRQSWIQRLLSLPRGSNSLSFPTNYDFNIEQIAWGENEKKLDPPVSLLSWLIRHPRKPLSGNLSLDPAKAQKRKEWLDGSDNSIFEGLSLLRNNPNKEDWHIFEGKTQPDVFIQTPSIIIVIEGKRTERKPTTSTKWMKGRHQMLRHLDCAWEIKGSRDVFGFFIVEGKGVSGEVPSKWVDFAKDTISFESIASSLPHRGLEEQRSIGECFIGVTTWQKLCNEFEIDWQRIPDSTEE